MTTKFNLPNLHGGISQLNPNLRDPGHFEASNNVLFDMFEGIQGPRWGTQEFINMPNTCKPLGYFTTSDGVLRWLVWNVENPADKKLEVWSHQKNTGVAVEGSFQYLMDAAGNLGDISLYPILDTVMVLNKNVKTALKWGDAQQFPYIQNWAVVRIPEIFEGATIQFRLSFTKSKGLSEHYVWSYEHKVVNGDTVSSILEDIRVKFNTDVGLNPTTTFPAGGSRPLALKQSDYVMFVFYGATVSHNGHFWFCVNSNSGIEPWSHPNWGTYWVAFDWPAGIPFGNIAWNPNTSYTSAAELNWAGCSIDILDNSTQEVITHSLVPREVNTPRNPKRYRGVLTAESYEKLPPKVAKTHFPDYDPPWYFETSLGLYYKISPKTQRYEECALPETDFVINRDSMPHELRYSPDTGEFFFGPSLKYEEFPRAVGDLTSAPTPDFVGKSLNYIFFHRNRMCFLAGNFVCMSKAGHYYDWFPDTATEVLDSDPISVFPTHDRYTPLLWAKPFNKQLLLIGDNKQFVLHSGYDALSPTTVAVDEATNYQILPGVEPVQLPTSLLLGLDHSPWLGLVEYSVGDQEIQTEGFLVSNVVPKFIPYDITGLVWVPSQSMVLLWKRGSPEVWVFKFTDMGDGETGQMAWSKWTMVLPVEHCYHDVTSGIIYWALQNEPQSLCMITKMDTTEDLKTIPQLDLRSEQIVNATTEIEVIWAPSGPSSQAPIGKYHLVDKSLKKSIGTVLGSGDNIKPDPNVFVGGPPSKVVYRGYEIPWSVTLSPLILRDEAGKPRGDISCNIENIQIEWSGGDFEVHTAGLGLPKRTTRVVPLDQNYGTGGYSPTNVLGTGASYQEPTPTRLMLMLPAKRATIELRNTSEGVFSTQVQSIGYSLDVVQDWG